MNRIAIIPARGGSRRIPRKNIIEFVGKPMIAWTVGAALESGCFDQVLASTDSEEIAEAAISAGASVPFLRQDCTDDYSSVSRATISALGQAEMYWQTRFDVVVAMMPNCPLRKAGHIRAAVEQFDHQGIDFQISCFSFRLDEPHGGPCVSIRT